MQHIYDCIEGIQVFTDDGLIWGEMAEEYDQKLWAVLETVKAQELKLRKETWMDLGMGCYERSWYGANKTVNSAVLSPSLTTVGLPKSQLVSKGR